MYKRLFVLILSVCMILQFSLAGTMAETSPECEEYNESNENTNNYMTYAEVKYSFLHNCDNGQIMHFNGHSVNGHYIVKYYSSDYQLLKTVNVKEELPMFGTFYAAGSYYYLLTGQENYQFDDELEIFRITKYDKNWKRIGSVGKENCNTSKPFSNGTPRMTHDGDCLLIRTSHLMYNGHQSNVTMQIDTKEMKFIFSHTHLSYVGNGYVSHSFNQFLQVDDGKLVTVDHGDAFPRSIVLMNYPTNIAEGSINSFSVVSSDMVEYGGFTGNNYTGASVGGFEVSSKSYLIAYNQIDYTDYDWKDPKLYLDKIVYIDSKPVSLTDGIETRDVYVSVKNKKSGTIERKPITKLSDKKSATTPYMVKISDNRYILLWTQLSCVKSTTVYPDTEYSKYYINVPDKKVYYVEIDSNGNKKSKIHTMDGNLSDCQPIFANGKIIWQSNKDNTNTLFDINVYDLTQTHCVSSNYAHIHNKGKVITKSTKTKTGRMAYNCKICGKYFTEIIPKKIYDNGDVNADNTINICDAALIKKYTIKSSSKINKDYADFNGDGKINIKDVTMLQKYLASYVVKK